MKDRFYYKDGTICGEYHYSRIIHREDGPAIEYADGYKEWYLNGERHCESGPAIEGCNGHKEWWLNGNLHREDGPAIEYTSGLREWYLNGKLHREDGPAISDPNCSRYLWYINGKPLTALNKKQLIKYMRFNNLTIAHLLTDSDEMIRTSAAKYKWKKTV